MNSSYKHPSNIGIGGSIVYVPPQLPIKSIHSESVWACDIDDTLIIWNADTTGNKTITFTEPHTNDIITVVVNENNIRLLKEKKSRGSFIILWSQGGWQYAETIAVALGIEKYVDIVMSKPVGLIDDLPAEKWLPNPVNIDYRTNYKKPNKG